MQAVWQLAYLFDWLPHPLIRMGLFNPFLLGQWLDNLFNDFLRLLLADLCVCGRCSVLCVWRNVRVWVTWSMKGRFVGKLLASRSREQPVLHCRSDLSYDLYWLPDDTYLLYFDPFHKTAEVIWDWWVCRTLASSPADLACWRWHILTPCGGLGGGAEAIRLSPNTPVPS